MKYTKVKLKNNLINKNNKSIDVIIFSASRPELLDITLNSFKKHITFSGKLNFFLEDGDFNHANSLISKQIAIKHGIPPQNINIEKVGSYGYAITNAFSRWITSRYIFFLEDDWECVKDINLDHVFDCLQKYTQYNQIKFNRRDNDTHNFYVKMQHQKPYYKKYLHQLPYEVTMKVNNNIFPAIGSLHWYFNPAIWRTDFIIPRWKGFYRNVHLKTNSHEGLLPDKNRPSPEWYVKNLGVLTWNKPGTGGYFIHRGKSKSIHSKQGFV